MTDADTLGMYFSHDDLNKISFQIPSKETNKKNDKLNGQKLRYIVIIVFLGCSKTSKKILFFFIINFSHHNLL